MINPAADWPIHWVESATSSSDLVREAVADGATSGTGFLVGEQTQGRGRRGANWSSAKGGMYYSLLLKPTFPAKEWFGLAFVASLAVREAIAACLPNETVGLKWPNDVLIKGRGKVSGILIEASGDNLIIGTGVNIAPVTPIDGTRLPAAAIQDCGSIDLTPHQLAESYRDRLARRYEDYVRNGFDDVRTEWLAYCLHKGEMMRVHLSDKTITGTFIDLGVDGTMYLLADDGATHHISTGDVELIGTV